MSYLHELVLEVFKAVEADGRHVSVLHGNCSLGLLVLTEEREVLKIMLRKFIYHCNIYSNHMETEHTTQKTCGNLATKIDL